MKKYFAILIFSQLSLINTYGQVDTLTIASEILNENRKVLIGLPSSYEYDGKDFKYPLIVLNDGEWHFNLVFEAIRLLYQNGGPKVIIAGIINTDRTRDLTHKKILESETSGGAAKYLDFIEKELMTQLYNKYRVSSYKVLMGHSAGGLFSTYSLIKKPFLFNSYIALTPTIRWDNFSILKELNSYNYQEFNSDNHSFFLGIGNEIGKEKEGVFKLKELFDIHLNSDNYSFIEYQTESHVTVPWKGYFDGIKFIFSEFNLPESLSNKEFKETIAYYKKTGSKYDYDDRVPQRIILNRGFQEQNDKEIDKAIEVFKYYKTYFPSVPIPYRALGDIYYESKKYKKAFSNYKGAYKLFPSAYLEKRIDILKKKLERD